MVHPNKGCDKLSTTTLPTSALFSHLPPTQANPCDRTCRRVHGSCYHLHLPPLAHQVDTPTWCLFPREKKLLMVGSFACPKFAAYERHRREKRAKRNRRCDERRTWPRITPRTWRSTWWEGHVPVGGRRREETSARREERYERAIVG